MRFLDKQRFPPPGVLGTIATVLILALAAIALKNTTIAIVLGVPALLLLIAEVVVIVRAARRSELADIEIRAYDLGSELREMVDKTPLLVKTEMVSSAVFKSPTDDDYARARAERIKSVVSSYDFRYATRARHLAVDFRRTGLIAAVTFCDRLEVPPKTIEDVLEKAVVLEALARQLREPVELSH
jgi:hypothetical protein